MTLEWLQIAANRYEGCIRETFYWILDRPTLGGFLDTKVNSLTGADYDSTSGLSGPEFTYGWIQGRGLESLVTFADHYRTNDPQFSARLSEKARTLYERLGELHARDGHAFFLYDPDVRPVRPDSGGGTPQTRDGSIFTYSDAFVAKGLLAASCHFDPKQSGQNLSYLQDVVAAIECGRFQMDETRDLSGANAMDEPDDFGPKMILLGATGVLRRANRSHDAAFADRFIDDVLERYFDPSSGLLLNIPGNDTCNVGHAIEFCGFAFEHFETRPDDPRIGKLVSILVRSLDVGLQGPGIALSLSARSGKAVSPYYPWWPLPEAIRACALGFYLTGDTRLLGLWQQADDAFFANYWQATRGFAFQTRTVDGPVDFVPATPDLDPGYHTGLSLLAVVRTIGALLGQRPGVC